jgi:hypothetical protein
MADGPDAAVFMVLCVRLLFADHVKRDGGLKLREASPKDQPQRLSSRALFGLGLWSALI